MFLVKPFSPFPYPRRYVAFLTTLALGVGLLFSVQWIYPLAKDRLSYEKPSYVPIKLLWGQVGWSDEYFYYSYVQDALTGHPFSYDPSTFEGKTGKRVTAHYTYTLSLLLASLGGFLTGNIEHAYYFNLFFFPFLYTLLLGALLYTLTQNTIYSIFSTLFIVHFTPSIEKMPHPMVTSIPLVWLGILFFKYLNEKGRPRLNRVLLALVIGLSPLMSVANFFTCFSLLGVYGLDRLLNEKAKRTQTFFLVFLAFLVASPTLFILIKNRPVFNELLTYTIGDLETYTTFYFKNYLGFMKFALVPFVFFLFADFPGRRYFLLSLGGILLAHLSLSVIQGSFAGSYVIVEGRALLFALVLGGLYAMAQANVKRFSLEKAGNLFKIASLLATLVFAFWHFSTTYQTMVKRTEEKLPLLFDTEAKGLYQWAMKNTKSGDVGMGLDFDSMLHLIVYAPIDLYVPEAVLSPLTEKERQSRFFETLAYFGVPPKAFHEWLTTQGNKELTHARFTLYYGKYWGKDLPEGVRAELVKNYTEVYSQNRKPSYRLTHLILSKRAAFQPEVGSSALEAIANKSPVFENQDFKVYKISEG